MGSGRVLSYLWILHSVNPVLIHERRGKKTNENDLHSLPTVREIAGRKSLICEGKESH
jgi:hypothetical protein